MLATEFAQMAGCKTDFLYPLLLDQGETVWCGIIDGAVICTLDLWNVACTLDLAPTSLIVVVIVF